MEDEGNSWQQTVVENPATYLPRACGNSHNDREYFNGEHQGRTTTLEATIKLSSLYP
jgi:hypothetical protein